MPKSNIFHTCYPLVLASNSPRRKTLLSSLGLSFEVLGSTIQEPAPKKGENPACYAQGMAELKAQDIAQHYPKSLVLGADTIVSLKSHILGKPKNEKDALAMLKLLSGQEHTVITGCCLYQAGLKKHSFFEQTTVRMRSSSQAELEAYIRSKEPMDKAGAYAIQGKGAFLVEQIIGSYTNVVGLPLAQLLTILEDMGAVAPVHN